MECPRCTGEKKGELKVLRNTPPEHRFLVCDVARHFFKIPVEILMSLEGPVPTDLIFSPRSVDAALGHVFISSGDENELQQLPTIETYRQVLGLPPSARKD
ncbi:MAG: hypothetical protein WCV85_05475 [Patescibacteria group bacterium]|jgi:hypothetical protein